jgi:hypothetical protein
MRIVWLGTQLEPDEDALDQKWYGEGYVQLSGSLKKLVRLSRSRLITIPYIRISQYSSIQDYIVDLQVWYGGER